MAAQNIQPRRRRRSRRPAVSVVLFLVLALLSALLLTAWQRRLALATRVVRGVLDGQGLADASFRLVRLSPGCVVLEDLRLGLPDPVFAVDRAELFFSYPDVMRGQLDRLRVRGVRTQAVVDGSRVYWPAHERLKPLLLQQAARRQDLPPDTAQTARHFSVGEVSVYDVQVALRLAAGDEVAAVQGDAGVLSEPESCGRSPERYRLWMNLRDGKRGQATASGTAEPKSGTLALSAAVDIKDVSALLACVRLVAPDRAGTLAFAPTNCSFAARGSLALTGWTNAGPFEVTAELGRGSAFSFAKPEGLVRFQTLRVEAAGTPQDVQCRLSAGIAGFRVGGQIQAQQEEGRLLSMRGTARFRQTPTNRWVKATLDSDLPGRSVTQALPAILPLVPRLLTDGGTLHAEADVAQVPKGEWQGESRFTAEARRSAVSMSAGRLGAGRVSVTGSLSIQDTRTGELRTEVSVEEGYFYGQGLSVRGGGRLALTSQPPYRSASGSFTGTAGEFATLPKRGILLSEGAVRFEGEASVMGLVSNPVWQVAMRVPDFGIASRLGPAAWQTTAGAAAKLSYSPACMALDGDVWLRDAVMTAAASGAVGRVEAGLSRATAHIRVPGFVPAAFSNAWVQVALDASNGWARVGDLLALEEARASVPFAWSLAGGLAFMPDPRAEWRRLEAGGVRVLPDGLALRVSDGAVEARFGVRVDESRFGVTALARVPLSDPRQSVIDLVLPETELTADDALSARLRRADRLTEVTGRVAAEARVRFPGAYPQVLGYVSLSGGQIKRGGMQVGGLSARIPFESGPAFRTIERPVVTFNDAKMGNLRLDKGRIDFQVTPQEVFVDRMEVGWCKGRLNAYSIHLDPKNPKADVIVYADRIDLGEALMMVLPVKGVVEGVLYGRFPVGIDNGHIKLSTGFLYSLPGQGGKLRLDDNAPMVTLLNRAGIKGEVQQPLSMALSDMDFSAIRMELEPKADGEAVLRMKLDGKSNFKEWPAPVALNLNLHGPLESLLNLGLDVSRK